MAGLLSCPQPASASRWLAPPRARIISAFAGTFSGFTLGGLAGLALVVVEPGTVAAGLLHEVAFLGYAAPAINLLPRLELDGHYILVDLPRLRERAFAFVLRAQVEYCSSKRRDAHAQQSCHGGIHRDARLGGGAGLR